MNLITAAPGWLVALLLLFLLAAAAEDGWRLEIGDWAPVGTAAAAFFAVALDGPIVGLWQNLLLSIAVLVGGTILFSRGWMGGGDIKLLAAVTLWFDLSNGWKLLVAIAIAGGFEALALIALRRIRWPESARRRALLLRPGEGIPYGIAIAMGAALMTWWLRW